MHKIECGFIALAAYFLAASVLNGVLYVGAVFSVLLGVIYVWIKRREGGRPKPTCKYYLYCLCLSAVVGLVIALIASSVAGSSSFFARGIIILILYLFIIIIIYSIDQYC